MTKSAKKAVPVSEPLASSAPEEHLQAITDARALTALLLSPVDQVQMIPLERLDVSPLNPRKTFDEVGLQELAASIKQSGILSPLLVRWMRSAFVELADGTTYDFPFGHPSETREIISRPDVVRTEVEDRYEIVAGHRRSEAATIAGLVEVPCIVREMDDATAGDVALIDNLQRADVPALEEAGALGQLLVRHGSIEGVAAKVGKDTAHVAKRLKLLQLTVHSQDALRERLINVDHALLLARLAETEQNEALKWTIDHSAGSTVPVEKVIADRLEKRDGKKDTRGICRECGCTHEEPCELEDAGGTCSWANAQQTLCTNPDCLEEAGQGERRPAHRYTWEPQSVQRLKDHIEVESGIPLSRAPWPMEEDWLSIDAGSCLDCPKNTKANAPLFADLDMGEPICIDGACFKEKTQVFVEIQQRDAAKSLAEKLGRTSPGDVEVLRVSWKLTSRVPRQLKDGGGANPAQIFADGQWIEAKKKICENARPAVTVDWDDANGRGYMGGNGPVRKPGEIVQACIEPKCKVHPKSYEKAKREGGRSEREDPAARKKREEEEVSVEKEEKQIRAKVFAAILEQTRRLEMGAVLRIVNDNASGSPAVRKQILSAFPKLSGSALETLTVFVNAFDDYRRVNGYWIQREGAAAGRKQMWNLAGKAGVDADAIAAKHFHDTFTDPGSMKGLHPEFDLLYPKAVKWPKQDAAASAPAKKAANKAPAKAAAKKAPKKKPSTQAKKKAVRK